MAVNKKGKRKRTLTGRFQTCEWVCGHVDMWTCGCVGVRMGVQPCGHADADGCKQKKKTLTGVFRMCGWACRCAEADNCKEKKKERKGKKKRKTHWSGHVDVLRMGMRALVGRRGWL